MSEAKRFWLSVKMSILWASAAPTDLDKQVMRELSQTWTQAASFG